MYSINLQSKPEVERKSEGFPSDTCTCKLLYFDSKHEFNQTAQSVDITGLFVNNCGLPVYYN